MTNSARSISVAADCGVRTTAPNPESRRAELNPLCGGRHPILNRKRRRMTVRMVHPPVGAPYKVPRLTRAVIETLIHGKLGSATPSVPGIIDRIVSINDALACIDNRRDSNGELSPADQREFAIRSEPLPLLFRQIHLYPVNM